MEAVSPSRNAPAPGTLLVSRTIEAAPPAGPPVTNTGRHRPPPHPTGFDDSGAPWSEQPGVTNHTVANAGERSEFVRRGLGW